jgi:hypothetical protein
MMLIDEFKEIKSSRADLKKFGLTLGIFFLLLGGVFLWRGRESFAWLFGLSFFFLLFAYLFPSLLRPIQKVWMGMALIMGWVMTRVILSILFYLVLTPIALFLKFRKTDILNLKFPDSRDSFWVIREKAPKDLARHEKQF